MMLRRRALILAAVIAVPVAVLAITVVDRVRTRDRQLALSRVVKSQINDQVRERCESDPKWFLTGPLEGRPPRGQFVSGNPDALEPRPKGTPQPFELFAYDERFTASSSAAPRFPNEFRWSLQASSPEVFAPYDAPEGTGLAMGVPTGWIGSPCMYFIGRMAPAPDVRSQRVRVGVGAFAVAFLVALISAAPVIQRARRLSRLARESAGDGYSTVALDKGKDELNVVTFVFNDAGNELRLRKSRIDDLEAALRRFVQSTDQEIAEPLRQLEGKLAGASDGRSALLDAHHLSAQVENLTAAARLRMSGTPDTNASIDLNALVTRLVSRHAPVAQASSVSIESSLPETPVTIDGDQGLVERAISNVVDNAIRYNMPGGRVTITLSREPSGERFRLFIADTGRGMSEEDFKTLTAIRRFRGDEGRNRRPGAPGLGLAVAREVADRFHLQLDLKRPSGGGFEVEFSGKS